MPRNILIILGHPALERRSFCAALADSYQESAAASGHMVARIDIAALNFDPILHEGYDGSQPPEPDIAAAQERIRKADHLVFIYPMWQFGIPALLKGFLERALTRDFAYNDKTKNPLQGGLLKGKSARLIQTMGMPGLFYRLWFGAHGGKALRDMLRFCGISPIAVSYLGLIESGAERRAAYLAQMRGWGQTGS